MEDIKKQIEKKSKQLMLLAIGEDDSEVIKSKIDEKGTITLLHTANLKGVSIIQGLSEALVAGRLMKEEDCKRIDVTKFSKGIEIRSENCDLDINIVDNKIQITFALTGKPDKILSGLDAAIENAARKPKHDKKWVDVIKRVDTELPPYRSRSASWEH